ncbi:MogA/MoaB family molybdenum cofactor biosynthesis protein [Pseudokineococcus marinus]|uniref:MogA/MoaB family molybdenum cofactor biosynthesis protein n=1 Tax=Pseudokineococcus marinus TaxID=351215 RepID=A0A849BRX1_9ACTN|nr:MogA/MoaB family molybdenum cofactor biosynthesis protein [Pseudokineococcus marinus]NNH24133.1 MogA/MoaB family molybdenum cofactor biosynthesis protein [Pseudokineococcus marinus]
MAESRPPVAAAGPRTGAVVVASTRAARGTYADEAGPLLADGLRAMGLAVGDPVVVEDGEPVGRALRSALAGGAAVVLTTGGTGLTPRDLTPEQTAPVLDRELPGLAEALRARGRGKGVPTSSLSRGLAGTAGGALVVNLPGSPGACRDALEVLAEVLPHALDQIAGGDHLRSGAGGDHLRSGAGGDHPRSGAGGDHRASGAVERPAGAR